MNNTIINIERKYHEKMKKKYFFNFFINNFLIILELFNIYQGLISIAPVLFSKKNDFNL